MTNTAYQKLTKKQQLSIAKVLHLGKIRLAEILLSIPECVGIIIDEYDGIMAARKKRGDWVTLAKLSLHYNASIKGRNKGLGENIQKNMDRAKAQVKRGDIDKAAKYILSSELHPRLYFSMKMREAANESHRARTLYAGLDRRRARLVRCVGGEIEEISARYKAHLWGDVISAEDILQEANLLAYQYTLIYDPTKGVYPTKWSSFAYSMIDKAIKNFIAESTRNVPVPRIIQDRYRPVRRVLSRVHTEDRRIIAALCNKEIVGKKGSISKEELYTEDEVDYLIGAVSSSVVSLDTFVQSDADGARPLAESISSDEPTSEDEVALRSAKLRLREMLGEILDPMELEAVILRYGLDRETGGRTIGQVVKEFSLKTNKLYVSNMLNQVEKKLASSSVRIKDIKTTIYKKGR